MSILLRARSYPLLPPSTAAEKIHLRGILSDLTLSNEPLCWSCDVAGFPALPMPAGCNRGGRAVWFAARVIQRRHQTKAQQDGWHLLSAYWPLIGNNKHSLNTISPWLADSNQPPTARHCEMHTRTSCANNKRGKHSSQEAHEHKTCVHTNSREPTCAKTIIVGEEGPLSGWHKITDSRNVAAPLKRQDRTSHAKPQFL